jgi:hypothetical protein
VWLIVLSFGNLLEVVGLVLYNNNFIDKKILEINSNNNNENNPRKGKKITFLA